MDVRRLGPTIGGEVVGLDTTRPLDDCTIDGLHEALLDHKVIVLRDVELDPAEHVRLGEALGEVEVHAFSPNLGPGFERISVLDSEAGTYANMWHTDETFLERPPMGT